MTDQSVIVMENDTWQVGLSPAASGSISFGRARIGGQWVSVMRETDPVGSTNPYDTASFALVPWSNRIRDGVLKWNGRDYQLRVNFPDGTAAHGTGIEYPWSVVEHSNDAVSLQFNSRNFYGVNFPWPFVATYSYRLEGASLMVRMAIENTSHETFPAGLGHHPYFFRALRDSSGTPVSDEALLQVNTELGYVLEDAMAVGPAGTIPARADYRKQRPLGTDFVDDCLTGRRGELASTITYPNVAEVTLSADSLLSHIVVYVPQGENFFAVEPVSNANDAFTLAANGVPGVGVFLVQPGETISTDFSVSVKDLS